MPSVAHINPTRPDPLNLTTIQAIKVPAGPEYGMNGRKQIQAGASDQFNADRAVVTSHHVRSNESAFEARME